MAVYMVSYDLIAPGKNYEPLLKAIRAYTACQCLKSAFFIDTAVEPQAIRENLTRHIDRNDKLWVVELRRNWAARNGHPCGDWLNSTERTWR